MSLQEIPKFVLAPGNTYDGDGGVKKTIEPRTVRVYGYGTYQKCLGCGHVDELDAFMFKPDSWPNVAIICGSKGCGIFWGLVSEPPDDVVWTYREN